MEENKFEKQVQQKMGELKIEPSEGVWPKIEVRIGKQRRSKRWLVLLFLFAGLVTAGYLIFNQHQQKISSNNDIALSNNEKNLNKENDKIGNHTSSGNRTDKNVTKDENLPVNSVPETQKNKRKSSQRIHLSNSHKIIIGKNTAQNFYSKSRDRIKTGNDNPEKLSIQAEPSQPSDIRGADGAGSKKGKEADISTAKDTSSVNIIKKIRENINDTSKNELVRSKLNNQTRKNKWKPGIFLSGGISRAGNNVFNTYNSSSYTNSPGPSGPAQAVGPSSHSATGPGFIIGFFEERNITAKTKISFGLNFKSLGSSFKVGSRNDTTGFYSSQNPLNNYNAHFNFIELPVNIKISIGRGKKVPLAWQGGIVLSELSGTNALQFNSVTHNYYKDNSLFNKTQIGFNTAAYVTIFSKQKVPLIIGPYYYYSISGISGEGLYNEKHFSFFGISAAFIFKK